MLARTIRDKFISPYLAVLSRLRSGAGLRGDPHGAKFGHVVCAIHQVEPEHL